LKNVSYSIALFTRIITIMIPHRKALCKSKCDFAIHKNGEKTSFCEKKATKTKKSQRNSSKGIDKPKISDIIAEYVK